MSKRRDAREAALQALYLVDTARTAGADAWTIVNRERTSLDDESLAFAYELFCGVLGAQESLDAAIEKAAEHWTISRMVSIDRCLLRLGAYELLHHPGTPSKVVINEAIEIGRDFSADDSSRFINGVLDKVARTALSAPKRKAARQKTDAAKKGS